MRSRAVFLRYFSWAHFLSDCSSLLLYPEVIPVSDGDGRVDNGGSHWSCIWLERTDAGLVSQARIRDTIYLSKFTQYGCEGFFREESIWRSLCGL